MMRVLIYSISLLSLFLQGCGLGEKKDEPQIESISNARGECYHYEMCLYKDVRYHCIMDTAVVDDIAHFIEKVEHNIKDCRNCFMDTTVVTPGANVISTPLDHSNSASKLHSLASISSSPVVSAPPQKVQVPGISSRANSLAVTGASDRL